MPEKWLMASLINSKSTLILKKLEQPFFDHNSKKTLFCLLLNKLKYVNVNVIKFKRYIQLSRAFLQS